MPTDRINAIAQTINAHLRAINVRQAMVDNPDTSLLLHKPSAFDRRRHLRRIEVLQAEVQCLWDELNAALAREAVEASLAAAAGAHRARI